MPANFQMNTQMSNTIPFEIKPPPHDRPSTQADFFSRQFPAINTLSEPLRSNVLNGLDSLLYSYLTKLGPNGVTNTWSDLAIFLQQTNLLRGAGWYNRNNESFKSRNPRQAAQVLTELKNVEMKLRRIADSGAIQWSGPWPRSFMTGRAAYNEYLRAVGFAGNPRVGQFQLAQSFQQQMVAQPTSQQAVPGASPILDCYNRGFSAGRADVKAGNPANAMSAVNAARYAGTSESASRAAPEEWTQECFSAFMDGYKKGFDSGERMGLTPTQFTAVAPPKPFIPVSSSFTDLFAKQFPGVNALDEPLRSKMLDQLNNIIYDYLTKLEYSNARDASPFGSFRVSPEWFRQQRLNNHTWQYWADYIANWRKDLINSFKSGTPSYGMEAVNDLKELENDLRSNASYGGTIGYGWLKWKNKWPRQFSQCRKSYNDYLRSRSIFDGLPPDATC